MDENFLELLQKAQGDRTQNEFALHCGISSAALTRIKRGEYKATPDTLKKIALRAYNGVTYEQLMQAAGFLDTVRSESAQTEKEESIELEGMYFHLAKEAQEMGLEKEDIDYILDFYRRHKAKNAEYKKNLQDGAAK